MSEKELRQMRRLVRFYRIGDILLYILSILLAASMLVAVLLDICETVKSNRTESEETAQVDGDKSTPTNKPQFHIITAIDPMTEALPEGETTTIEPIKPIQKLVYYDVPLDKDLQKHIITVSESYNIEPSIIFAMIERESRFKPNVIGDNGRSYGLMQIQQRWHQDRMKRLGVTDLLDPYQNVLVGIDYLAELFSMNEDVEWVLMAYNGGLAYANKLTGSGKVSAYATGVLEAAREMRGAVG